MPAPVSMATEEEMGQQLELSAAQAGPAIPEA